MRFDVLCVSPGNTATYLWLDYLILGTQCHPACWHSWGKLRCSFSDGSRDLGIISLLAFSLLLFVIPDWYDRGVGFLHRYLSLHPSDPGVDDSINISWGGVVTFMSWGLPKPLGHVDCPGDGAATRFISNWLCEGPLPLVAWVSSQHWVSSWWWTLSVMLCMSSVDLPALGSPLGSERGILCFACPL